ncbi:MAG: hypothetical protein GXP61_09170 [Epsilonproteobacteria bacterium]|nr:hypothetical protein [Campylobacterota bacterium]
MIKTIIILISILQFSFATNLNDIKNLYDSKKFAQVCIKSGNIYQNYKDNEEFLNIFASSCLKADMINRMVLPIIKLYKTKEARENAVYFTTILFEKKLLYYALSDDLDISYVNLPKTNYILSKIFDKYVKGEYDLKNDAYWFSDDNNSNLSYKLSIEERNGVKKMYLRTYRKHKIIKVRVYW